MSRLRSSFRAASVHFGLSAAIAALCAVLVFTVWYPYPYREISGGRILFQILVAVDVVCGPLLTFILFNPLKSRRMLVFDLGVVVLIQVAALGYGLWSVAQARPLYLAFEGDRFRVVGRADVALDELPRAPAGYQELHFGSPKLLGVKLLKSNDRDFVDSIEQSLAGNHPAYRPARWVPFEQQQFTAAANAQPLNELSKISPTANAEALAWLAQAQLKADDVGFYFLLAEMRSDWVVLVSKRSGLPLHFVVMGE